MSCLAQAAATAVGKARNQAIGLPAAGIGCIAGERGSLSESTRTTLGSPDGDLAGRVALVAGAASGIGAAVARELHGRGATLVGADRDRAGLDRVLAELPGAVGVDLEVREEADWEAALRVVGERFGRLDILVNAVGVAAGSPLVDTALADWRQMLAINLDGAFLATKHAIRAMTPHGGVIVHLGSASGIRAAAGAAAYSTSKAGLRMLVATAAKECRQAGLPIRINLVSPAGVKTPMWSSMPFFRDLVATTGSEEAAFAAMAQGGGGVFSEPADIARVVGFLVSDAGRHCTGVELPVDDGFVL